MRIQYYLIHNGNEERKNILMNEFQKWGFDINNIKWIIHPNKEELNEELINNIVYQYPCESNGKFLYPSHILLRRGVISCTYKHYLALKDIVENGYEYSVIMEDNIYFLGKIPELVKIYIDQLNNYYGDWDIVFDNEWVKYIEGPIIPGIHVYPKSNEITQQCHGGTKGANFYLLTNSCAKKLFDNYLPFYHQPDWYMNDLFRKLNIKSFWIEPSMVRAQNGHKSNTAHIDKIEKCNF